MTEASDLNTGDNRTSPILVCAGYLNIDIIAYVPGLPGADERLTALGMQRTLGGIATNAACAAATLGKPWALNVELIATVGDDPDSEWAEAAVRRRGVHTDWLTRRSKGHVPFCLILVEPNGQRAIISEPVHFDDAQVGRRLTQPGEQGLRRLLYVDGYCIPTSLPYIQQAVALGWLTAIDLDGLPPDWRTPEKLADIASTFHVVFMNRGMAEAIWPGSKRQTSEERADIVNQALKAACAPLQGPPHSILLTAGEEGAWVLQQDAAPIRIPALSVRPVDTTGAGDVFAGVLLAAWLNGETLVEAARLASIAAGLSTTARGAQGFLPSATDILNVQVH